MKLFALDVIALLILFAIFYHRRHTQHVALLNRVHKQRDEEALYMNKPHIN